MTQTQSQPEAYLCPMHRNVRQSTPGTCTKCGMDLVPEGARFGLLRHMMKSPVHVVIMAAVMVAIMVGIMIAAMRGMH
jgi:hypothetical protein